MSPGPRPRGKFECDILVQAPSPSKAPGWTHQVPSGPPEPQHQFQGTLHCSTTYSLAIASEHLAFRRSIPRQVTRALGPAPPPPPRKSVLTPAPQSEPRNTTVAPASYASRCDSSPTPEPPRARRRPRRTKPSLPLLRRSASPRNPLTAMGNVSARDTQRPCRHLPNRRFTNGSVLLERVRSETPRSARFRLAFEYGRDGLVLRGAATGSWWLRCRRRVAPRCI